MVKVSKLKTFGTNELTSKSAKLTNIDFDSFVFIYDTILKSHFFLLMLKVLMGFEIRIDALFEHMNVLTKN